MQPPLRRLRAADVEVGQLAAGVLGKALGLASRRSRRSCPNIEVLDVRMLLTSLVIPGASVQSRHQSGFGFAGGPDFVDFLPAGIGGPMSMNTHGVTVRRWGSGIDPFAPGKIPAGEYAPVGTLLGGRMRPRWRPAGVLPLTLLTAGECVPAGAALG